MQRRQQARGRPEARGRLERGGEGNLGLLSRERPQELLAVTVGAGGEGGGLQVSGIMEKPLSEMENTDRGQTWEAGGGGVKLKPSLRGRQKRQMQQQSFNQTCLSKGS